MTLQHHLETKLKRLRLSGMLETLEDRTGITLQAHCPTDPFQLQILWHQHPSRRAS